MEQTRFQADELCRSWSDSDLQECLSWPLFLREYGHQLGHAGVNALWGDTVDMILNGLLSRATADSHNRLQALAFIHRVVERWWAHRQNVATRPLLTASQTMTDEGFLETLIDAGVFCVSPNGIEFAHPVLLEYILAQLDGISLTAMLGIGLDPSKPINFNRWVRFRLEYLAERRQFKGMWNFVQSVGLGHFDLLSHSWLNLRRLMPVNSLLKCNDVYLDLLEDVSEWVAQMHACINHHGYLKNRPTTLPRVFTPPDAVNSAVGELRQHYSEIMCCAEELASNLTPGNIGAALSTHPLKRDEAKRLAAISLCRFMEPTTRVTVGRLLQREMTLANALVDIACHEGEEEPERLCAASVLVSWNDKRMQAVLRKLSSNEHSIGQSRIRLLELAAKGNVTARLWV
jgi:hypothetical protein